MTTQPVNQTYVIQGFRFQDGTQLDLNIGYWTLGKLNQKKSNAVLVCHGASGDLNWALPFARPGGAYDTDRFFVISIDLPGGGSSSRESTTAGFPSAYSVRDLTNAVAGLITGLGISHIVAFSGASLASLIGADLAASYPEMVRGLALWNCGVEADCYAGAVVNAICCCLALNDGRDGMVAAVTAFLPCMLGRAAVARMDAGEQKKFVNGIATTWSKTWTGKEISARYRCVANAALLQLYGGADALASKLVCPILWLPSSSDVILPAVSIESFARSVNSAQVEVCQTDNGHVSTAASPGSAEFKFYDEHTAKFLSTLSI